ncbi:hypothetical protein, conserved [Eimeria maxima]|uniref:Uncharacterized protein n=1 Tax=Eimeria maxima TaxID=5804 RepID=U6M4S8_EIMMA|nr:hypothetical protein, conserved [Eimeria maxima]CDJ59016.1 hypothetical protein, conserved [Eimeria maxima]
MFLFSQAAAFRGPNLPAVISPPFRRTATAAAATATPAATTGTVETPKRRDLPISHKRLHQHRSRNSSLTSSAGSSTSINTLDPSLTEVKGLPSQSRCCLRFYSSNTNSSSISATSTTDSSSSSGRSSNSLPAGPTSSGLLSSGDQGDTQQQQQNAAEVGFLKQRDSRVSPLLLPSLRRVCRQLRFLSVHPHLLAALCPPKEKTLLERTTARQNRTQAAAQQEEAKRNKAQRKAALLLNKVWGGATYFSPHITRAALSEESTTAPAAGAASPAAVNADTATSRTSRAVSSPPEDLQLPQLLTRVATRYVRREVQQHLLQQQASAQQSPVGISSESADARAAAPTVAGAAAIPRSVAGTAVATPSSAAAGPAAAVDDLPEALFAASRWLSAAKQQCLRVSTERTVCLMLHALRTLSDLEMSLQKGLHSAAAAAASGSSSVVFMPVRAATPASASAADAEGFDLQQVLQLGEDLVDALQAEKKELLQQGARCLRTFIELQPDKKKPQSSGSSSGSSGSNGSSSSSSSTPLFPSRRQLHQAANRLLPGHMRPFQRPQQQRQYQQQQQQQQQQHAQQQQQLRGLSGAFRLVPVEQLTADSLCASGTSNSSNSSSSNDGLRPGLLLVAHPFLADAFVRESVVLLTSVSQNTVEGFMLNRSCSNSSNNSSRHSSSGSSTRRGMKLLQRSIETLPSPLHLLAAWQERQRQQPGKKQQQREQQQEQSGQVQQPDVQRCSTGVGQGSSWLSLLEENPQLFLLLREAQVAAAAAQASWRKKKKFLQQQQQLLHQALVTALAQRAVQTLPLSPHNSSSSSCIIVSTSGSKRLDGVGSSSSSSTSSRSSSSYILRAAPAGRADAGPLDKLLSPAFSGGRQGRDGGAVREQQQQQQRQQQQLLLWLENGFKREGWDSAAAAGEYQARKALLQQLFCLLQQLQLAEAFNPPNSNSSSSTITSTSTCTTSSSSSSRERLTGVEKVRLGGPCEGFVKLRAERWRGSRADGARASSCLYTAESQIQCHAAAAAAGAAAAAAGAAGAAGAVAAGAVAQVSESDPLSVNESLFLGKMVWKQRQLQRELREGLWLLLECTDTAALEELVFGSCSACSPVSSKFPKLKGGKEAAAAAAAGATGAAAPAVPCPLCCSREVYRQLLAAADNADSPFFASAYRLSPLVAVALQQAVNGA